MEEDVFLEGYQWISRRLEVKIFDKVKKNFQYQYLKYSFLNRETNERGLQYSTPIGQKCKIV